MSLTELFWLSGAGRWNIVQILDNLDEGLICAMKTSQLHQLPEKFLLSKQKCMGMDDRKTRFCFTLGITYNKTNTEQLWM